MKKQPISDKDEKKPSRALRGGALYYDFRYVRISIREGIELTERESDLGFRIVRSKDKKK